MAVWGFDCKRSKPFSYQKSVSAFLHKQKKSRLHMQSWPSWWRWFGHGESHGLKILVSAEWIKRLLRSVINTYINTIIWISLTHQFSATQKDIARQLKLPPTPHAQCVVWCFGLQYTFCCRIFCLYIFLHFCVEKYGRFFHFAVI